MAQRDPRLSGGLQPLRELRGYRVAEHDSDPRGWGVMAPGGRRIGRVEELVVDTAAMKVRYLVVEVDHAALAVRENEGEAQRRILVELDSAQVNDDRKEVHLPTTPPLVAQPIR